MQTLIFDIEANALLQDATKIWTIVAYNLEENKYHIYLDKEENYSYPKNSIIYINIEEYLQLLTSSYLVGHNVLGFDLPLLKKLYNFNYSISPSSVADTIIMSRLFFPDRPGHSVAYWGEVFKFPKGDHSDFSCLSQEMLTYCIRDVDITRRVYAKMLEEQADWDWIPSLTLEYAMQALQVKQETHGVLFAVDKARELVHTICKEIEDIEHTVVPLIPPSLENLGPVNKPFKKDGTLSNIALKWLEDDTVA